MRRSIRSNRRGVDLGIIAILFIAGAVAVFFGVKKIPALARALGRAKSEFRMGELEVAKEVKAAEKALKEL